MLSFAEFCANFFKKHFDLHPTEAIYYGIEGYDHLLKDYTDLATRLFKKIRPLSDAIYHKQPQMQHWVVEKEALVARGRFPRPVVQPPFQPLKPEHIEGIRTAVAAAGLAPLA
ncbi:MAG: hypothetical protein HY694_18875 [Deltaproteobacteria bacterium]|nr:hypothetical protein [Deltaproteobacteria bacterium]